MDSEEDGDDDETLNTVEERYNENVSESNDLDDQRNYSEEEVDVDGNDVVEESVENDGQLDGVPEIVDVMRLFLNHVENEGIEISNDDDDDIEDERSDEEEINAELGEGSPSTTSFDTGLPTTHSYLGDDLELLHGRTIHADGELVFLPLFYVPNVVIVPGQILPLNLFHPQAISMMKRVIAADKTFGLISSENAVVGVTCEIYSVKEEIEYGVSQMMLKAEGRQRFKILKIEPQLDGILLGKIKILPDTYISPQPRGSLICSQQYEPNALRGQVISNRFHLADDSWSTTQRYLVGFDPKKARMLCTSLSSIQGWIYKLYNPYFLMDCLLNEIRSWNQNLQFDTIPRDPVEFSHWITANLPFTNEMKIELLRIDSASLRLRKQIEYMEKCASSLACDQCNAIITDKNDLFSLSKRGPMGAYVNPNGYVHETVTFYKAKNLSLHGRKSKQFSWFPGYSWTIANCKMCGHHMGWKFTANEKNLKPSKFWGLTRVSLKPVFKETTKKLDEAPPNFRHDEREASSYDNLNPEQNESSI